MAAIVRHTQQVIYLDDGELAVVSADGFRTYNLDSTETAKRAETVNWGIDSYDKDGHSHYMRKEILEQPEAIAGPCRGRLDRRTASAHLGGVDLRPGTCSACAGSSCWAAARRTTRRRRARD